MVIPFLKEVLILEDKTFELLSKLYGEFSEFRKETKEDIQGLKSDIVRIENKLDTNSKALFDGYKQTYEKLESLEIKVDDISSKVEKQDVEIRVIKGGR